MLETAFTSSSLTLSFPRPPLFSDRQRTSIRAGTLEPQGTSHLTVHLNPWSRRGRVMKKRKKREVHLHGVNVSAVLQQTQIKVCKTPSQAYIFIIVTLSLMGGLTNICPANYAIG